jgi:hypothetical protein
MKQRRTPATLITVGHDLAFFHANPSRLPPATWDYALHPAGERVSQKRLGRSWSYIPEKGPNCLASCVILFEIYARNAFAAKTASGML